MKDKPQIPPKTFWEDDSWAHENYQLLLKDYPNKWIAVLNKTVVCANEDLSVVRTFLTKKLKGKVAPLLHIEDASHVY